MDNGFLWLVVVAVVIGVLIYFGNRGKQQERLSQKQERLSQLITPLDHFSDLAAKGIQIKLIAGEPPNIALRIGEHMLCVFPNTTLLEPRAVRTWLSNYGGASIRVAKGLSFGAGQSRGVSESHDEMRAIDLGTLLLTNERLVFIGSQRTSSIALEKVIDIEGLSDGLVVHREGKGKIEAYQLSDAMQMNYQYDGQTLAAPVDGRLVKLVIDEGIAFRRNAVASSELAVSNGDTLLAEGNLMEALQSYRESLAIRTRLVKADPDNPDCQRALAVSYQRIGDVLLAQGNLGQAMKLQRDGFAIMDRLAKADPGNTAAQRDLLVSYKKVGDVLLAQGNVVEVLHQRGTAAPRAC
jgi:hypothetical protein